MYLQSYLRSASSSQRLCHRCTVKILCVPCVNGFRLTRWKINSVIPLMSHQDRLSLQICLQLHFISQTSFASSHFSNSPPRWHAHFPQCPEMLLSSPFCSIDDEFTSALQTLFSDHSFPCFYIYTLCSDMNKYMKNILLQCQTQESIPLLILFVPQLYCI